MGIGEGQVLIGKLLHDAAGFGEFQGLEASDVQTGQFVDEGEKMDSPLRVIATKEPAVAFGDEQGVSVELRRGGEGAAEEGVVAVGPVQEGDEGLGVDVVASLFDRKPTRQRSG